MTFSFLWFAVGLAVGVNATLAGLWWSLRRENRKAAPAIDYAEQRSRFEREQQQRLRNFRETGASWIEPLASRRADQ